MQLRLAGLSRSQIADALGLRSGGQTLTRWLRGVRPPAGTRRPRAKDDLRETAVAMRTEGRSYREIREVIGVSQSTLYLWLRDVALTDEQRQALTLRGREATSARATENRALAARRRAFVRAQARSQIAELSESELFVAGGGCLLGRGDQEQALAARTVREVHEFRPRPNPPLPRLAASHRRLQRSAHLPGPHPRLG